MSPWSITGGRGVEAIGPRGVVAAGRAYDLDCLIYATGFEVGAGYNRRAGYEIYGRDGVSLADKWAGGVATLHGLMSAGFPNLFVMSNSQSGFTANFPHMMNEQARHLAYIVAQCVARRARAAEPSTAAEEAWVQAVVDCAVLRQKFLEDCTPGYYNNEGKPSALAARNGPYGGGPIAFVKILETWRADGRLEGVELR